MKKLYRNSKDRLDKVVYVGDPTTMEIPAGFTELVEIYHVERVDNEEEADYSVVPPKIAQNQMGNQDPTDSMHYKFSSQKGREAWKKGGCALFKTSDPNAVTCPDCLIAIGLEELVSEFVIAEEEEEEVSETQES